MESRRNKMNVFSDKDTFDAFPMKGFENKGLTSSSKRWHNISIITGDIKYCVSLRAKSITISQKKIFSHLRLNQDYYRCFVALCILCEIGVAIKKCPKQNGCRNEFMNFWLEKTKCV